MGQLGLLSGPGFLANFIVVSSDFCTLSYHFVLFWTSYQALFKKLLFFENCVPNCFFSNFLVLSLFYSPFLGLLKHYKIGVQQYFVVFVVQRAEKAKEKITGISGLGFCPKMAVS